MTNPLLRIRQATQKFTRSNFFLLRVFDAFLPAEVWEANDRLLVFRGRVFISFCLVMQLFLIPLGLFNGLLIGWAAPETLISGGLLGLLAVCILIFSYFRSENIAFLLLLIGGMGLYFIDLYQTGLIFSPGIIWAPIFVWAVGFYRGKGYALVLGGICVAFVFFFWGRLEIETSVPLLAQHGASPAVKGLFEFTAAITAAIFLSFLFRWAKDRLEQDLEQVNSDLQMASDALESHMTLLKKILETIPHSICIKDHNGHVLKVNPAMAELFGMAPDAMEGMGALDLAEGNREEAQVFRRTDQDVIAGGFPLDFSIWRPLPNGNIRYLQVLKTPLAEGGEKHFGLLETWVDVTAQVVAEQKARIFERMEAIIQTIGGVCHMTNNQNQIILGNLQKFNRGFDPDTRKAARKIANAVQATTDVNQHLLTYARKRLGVNRKPLDLLPLLEDGLDRWRQSDLPGIELKTHFEKGLAQVTLNPGDVMVVRDCLLSNAFDALDGPGSIELRVSNVNIEGSVNDRCCIAGGKYVEVLVSDDGSGMTPSVKKKSFEPFFTTKDSAIHGGLGLSKVIGIVSESKGYVQIHSQPGKGTSVRVLFPALETG